MNCDKCNKPVEKWDDVTWLISIADNAPTIILTTNPRHIRCSPSRAQYIIHDDFLRVKEWRHEYDKYKLYSSNRIKELEYKWTRAWLMLQTHKKMSDLQQCFESFMNYKA
jgi:hypothetical protein